MNALHDWEKVRVSHRLMGLWEIMETFKVGEIMVVLHDLVAESSIGMDDTAPLHPRVRVSLTRSFQKLLDMCEPLGLIVTTQNAKDALVWLEGPELSEETGMFSRMANSTVRNMRIELDARQFFYVKPEAARYYDIENLFSVDVLTKFPSISFEIDEAGKCITFGRYTAAVFHLMRVMEIGIGAARKGLGLPEPIKPAERNWGAILRSIKTEIDSRNDAKQPEKSWASPSDPNFYSGILASLDAVRVAWRNTTMHVENKYTEEEAEHILIAVRGFMKNLSSRLDENGEPQALAE